MLAVIVVLKTGARLVGYGSASALIGFILAAGLSIVAGYALYLLMERTSMPYGPSLKRL